MGHRPTLSKSNGLFPKSRVALSVNCHYDNDDHGDDIDRRKSGFSVFFGYISSLRRELPPTRTLKWPGRVRVQGGH